MVICVIKINHKDLGDILRKMFVLNDLCHLEQEMKVVVVMEFL